VRTVARLDSVFYNLCCPIFCFAHSSRANEAGQTTCGLLHTCSLPIIIYFFDGSSFRTKFTCERGCLYVICTFSFHLVVECSILLAYFIISTYSTKFTCERGCCFYLFSIGTILLYAGGRVGICIVFSSFLTLRYFISYFTTYIIYILYILYIN
jgi:hypothetical protein